VSVSQTLEVPDQVNKFLKHMENIKSASKHTLKAYERDLAQTFGKLEAIRTQELLTVCHQSQLRWGGLQASSRNRKTAVLKSFLGYLFDQGLIETDLRHQLVGPKVPKKLPHYISLDEILAVLQTFKGHESLSDRREQALFFLLYGSGLRISEACSLKWEQFSWDSHTVRITGKGGRERLVVLPEQALRHLQNLFKEAPTNYLWGEGPLDPRTGFGWIRAMGERAGLLKPLNPHALRHSFATHLLSSGANLRTLQELLGHTSLVATEKYTHLTVDQLARTMERHHPLKHLKES
jgi:site-specific recombinase XerD